jgi:outer membrane protein assembly factor BamB
MTVDKVLRDACLTGGSMKNRLAIVGILVGIVPNAIGGAVAGSATIPFMSDRSLSRSRLSRLIAAIATVAGLLLSARPVDAAWTRFHGDADNTGFVDVVTTPAGKDSRSVPGLGTFAPGSGPVIAPDGTVYLGTQEGKLIALHADGSPAWTRELAQVFGTNLAIVASPAVGADGSIYVIGVSTLRDHRDGRLVTRHISELHKFSPGGGFLWHTRLPEGEFGTGANASAPPNIWQSSGAEAVMVAASFGLDRVTRLFAFSADGAILTDTVVSRRSSGTVAGGGFCTILPFFCFPFHLPLFPPPPADPADRLPANVRVPPPGPLMLPVSGGPPVVVVADQFHDMVGYNFFPGQRFLEVLRAKEPARFMRSSPISLFGQSAVGTTKIDQDRHQDVNGAIVFASLSASKLPAVPTGRGPILATPTRLADVRFVALESRPDGSAILVMKRSAPRVQVLSRTSLPGQSLAAPAASRTHVFVSTAGAFHSFDAGTMSEVGRFSWVGGGLSPPAIGPAGHVYAIASNILFIFPPPS